MDKARVVDLAREYQRLCDLHRDIEHVDVDNELFKPGQVDRMIEEIEHALVRCRKQLGIKS